MPLFIKIAATYLDMQTSADENPSIPSTANYADKIQIKKIKKKIRSFVSRSIARNRDSILIFISGIHARRMAMNIVARSDVSRIHVTVVSR